MDPAPFVQLKDTHEITSLTEKQLKHPLFTSICTLGVKNQTPAKRSESTPASRRLLYNFILT